MCHGPQLVSTWKRNIALQITTETNPVSRLQQLYVDDRKKQTSVREFIEANRQKQMQKGDFLLKNKTVSNSRKNYFVFKGMNSLNGIKYNSEDTRPPSEQLMRQASSFINLYSEQKADINTRATHQAAFFLLCRKWLVLSGQLLRRRARTSRCRRERRGRISWGWRRCDYSCCASPSCWRVCVPPRTPSCTRACNVRSAIPEIPQLLRPKKYTEYARKFMNKSSVLP